MVLTTDDHIEIQQLYTRYQLGVDGVLGVDDWLSCWTDDGEHRMYLWAPNYPKGLRELRAAAERVMGARSRPTYHWTSSPHILPAAFGATGYCYCLGIVEGDDAQANVGPALLYEDELVRDRGAWKFRRRTIGPRGSRTD